MQHGRAFVVVGVLAAGCAEPSVPTEECGGVEYAPLTGQHLLDEFVLLRPRLVVKTTSRDDQITSLEVSAALWYGDLPIHGTPAVRGANGYECPLLDDSFSATLDRLHARVTHPGGWWCLGTGGSVCSPPAIAFDYAIGREITDPTIVISDASTTIAIPGGNAFAPRTVSPLDPADWALHANQTVIVAWAPESDLDDVDYADVGFTPTVSGTSFGIPSHVVGNSIELSIPDKTGEGLLEIAVVNSTDTNDYGLVRHMTVQQPVTITP
ncbi:MAG: hypothetical protein HOV81_31150 [Kofleriaceae bacterium]|nr:hypothetical protein [Kofleriaceae bacterium]